MKNLRSIAAVVLVALAAPASGQGIVNESVCGASPGGLWSLVGVGLDTAVKEFLPGSTITYQTSSGGLANVVQVTTGVCALGIANDGDLIFARDGIDPFESPVEGLTALAVLYDWAPVWWIARADWAEQYGIVSLDDLAANHPPTRLVFNRRGLLTSAITESTLEALGVSMDDIEDWGGSVQYQASGEQTNLFRDGRVDLMANTLFEGHSSLIQMASAVDIRLIQVPDAAAQAVIAEYGLQPWTIPASANPGQGGDINTVTTSIILFANESLDEEVAYSITRAMIDHSDAMGAVSDAMQRFTPEGMLAQTVLPFHPGALRAYQEAGLR